MITLMDFSSEKKFSKEMAENIKNELPVRLLKEQKKILSVNKTTSILESIFSKANTYGKEKKIGFLRRSILLNSFKWELKEAGYPNEFINIATEGLIFALIKK